MGSFGAGDSLNGSSGSAHLEEVAWGIPRSPESFVKAAVSAGHPKLFDALLPRVLDEAVKVNASLPCDELAAARTAFFRKWTAKAAELAGQESELKASMPDHRRRVVESKRLLLWECMLREYDYPDLGVVDLMKEGVSLIGQVPLSGVFDPEFVPAQLTPEQLIAQSTASRRMILEEVSKPSSLDDVILEKTEIEAEKGWVSGELKLGDLQPGAIINKRFAIMQHDRPSVIDDCSGSMLNVAVQKTESPKPQSTDLFASLCLALLRRLPGSQVEGKCVDLKAAYRQVPIADDSLHLAHIAFYSKSRKGPSIRQMYALPFGASCAVYGYLRIAHSLWFLLVRALSVMVTHFFDDFISVGRSREATILEKVVLTFFNLLGWQVSVDKELPFAETFSALGIRIAFSRFLHGEVLFMNTESRIAEVSAYLDALVSVRKTTPKELQRIRGRMLFAGGQLFGRVGRACIKALRQCESHPGGQVDDRSAEAFTHFRRILQEGLPRTIKRLSSAPVFLFTDAAYDRDSKSSRCGLGGVLVSAEGRPLAMFSVELDDRQKNLLGERKSKTIIFEAELVATILGVVLWKNHLSGRPVVCYTDNNGTRDVLINASARNEVGSRLVQLYLGVESLIGFFPWFSRVPSPSNIADDPSKLLGSSFIFGGE